MTLDLTAFIQEFRTEAAEHLARLDRELLSLERDPTNPTPIRAMFLAAHTLKGGAAMLDLPGVRDLTHALEDALAELRDQPHIPSAKRIGLLFHTVDALRELISHSEPGKSNLDAEGNKLLAALRQKTAVTPAPAPDGARVLLLEDSATVRLLETIQLQEANLEVTAAVDSHQALELLHYQPFELIVVDADCQIAGVEAWHDVLAQRDTAVILTSCDDALPNEQKALLPAQAIVRKGTLRQCDLVKVALSLLGTSQIKEEKE